MESENRHIRAVQFALEAKATCDKAKDVERCNILSNSRICYLSNPNNAKEIRFFAEMKEEDIREACTNTIIYISQNTANIDFNAITKANTILMAKANLEACNEGKITYCKKQEKIDYSYLEYIIEYMKKDNSNFKEDKESSDFKLYQSMYNFAVCQNVKQYKELVSKANQKSEYAINQKPYCKKYLDIIGKDCDLLIRRASLVRNQEQCKSWREFFIKTYL